MSRRVLVVLALASVLVVPAVCGGRRKEKLAEQSFGLPNGLQLDLVAPCGDQVGVVVLFAVGSDHDPPGRSGMTRVIGKLLAMAAGAERAVDTGTDHTRVSAVVAGEQLEADLDAVAAWMGRFAPTEADLGRARADVLAELAKRRGGDPSLTAVSYAAESVQPTRGNGWRGGVASEIEAIDLDQVRAFWDAHFKPGNARLVLVGRFAADEVASHVESAFASLPPGKPPVLRDPATSTVTGTLVMGDAPRVVAMAVPAPPPSAPVYPAFLVLAGRLIEGDSAARTWAATYDPLMAPETLFVTGPVQPGEQPEPAAARIRAELEQLIARPLAPEDTPATRTRFRPFLGLDGLESACKADPRALAVARARRAQLRLGEVPVATALEALTQEQLADAARLFAPRRTAAVIAGGTIR